MQNERWKLRIKRYGNKRENKEKILKKREVNLNSKRKKIVRKVTWIKRKGGKRIKKWRKWGNGGKKEGTKRGQKRGNEKKRRKEEGKRGGNFDISRFWTHDFFFLTPVHGHFATKTYIVTVTVFPLERARSISFKWVAGRRCIRGRILFEGAVYSFQPLGY